MASEFAAAWGILDGFYKDPQSAKIAYGPTQPQYKEYLATMAKWYKEGLIDPEYASIDNKSLNAKIQGDLVGSTYGYVGASLGNNTKAARAKLPNFTLTGVTPPIGPSGKAYNHAADRIQKVGLSAVITKTSKYQKEVAQLMNYLYSEEGQTLLNWGIEGKSYTVDNGKKQFTDGILKNTEGKAPAQAVFQYAFPAQGFTKVMDFEPYKQINLGLPEQVEAVQNWAKGDTGLNVPTLSFNSEESSKLPTIMNDINTYKSEMVTKFIMGVEPIDKFDEFVKKIKDMKIDEATKINQAAFDRFNARK
jgi:putative aldouronate transport system substrate-binding protein